MTMATLPSRRRTRDILKKNSSVENQLLFVLCKTTGCMHNCVPTVGVAAQFGIDLYNSQ